MATRRLPGLQVPSSVASDVAQFCESVRERLEILSSATSTAATAQNTAAVATSNGERIDLTLLPLIDIAATDPQMRLLVQGIAVADRAAITVDNLFNVFGRVDQETISQVPWSWENEDYGFDISGPSPRFRWVELPEGDGVEDVLPTDSAIWDVQADAGVLKIRFRNDDDDDGADVILVGRTGLNADYVNVQADALEHNGVQVITGAGTGLAKTDDELALEHLGLEDLIDPGTDRGVFWDGSASAMKWLEYSAAFTITGELLDIDESELDHNSLGNLDVGDPHPQYAPRLVPLSPPQITAGQNDYAPTGIATATVLRLESDAARVITGLVPFSGLVFNVGGFDLTFPAEDVLSAAEHRFAFPADITIPPKGGITLWYDEVTERHRCAGVSA